MRQALLVVAVVLLLRMPFLNQAIQGDDVNYLAAAQHAQIDPAHPGHVHFIFQGREVTMQGHPHPPGNAWTLAALLALTGDIREPVYHGAYVAFSLIVGLAALALARRFTPHALPATLLFLVTPAFVINGNSLESDLPFLAFWLAAIALYVYAVDSSLTVAAPLAPSSSHARKQVVEPGKATNVMLVLSAVSMGLAAMMAFQSVLLAPLLGLYTWQKRRSWMPAWIALGTVPLVLDGWQLFEKLTSEQLPAQVLAGYFQTYGLQSVANKLKNAASLTTHLGWIAFPLLPLLALARTRWYVPLGAAAAAAFVDPHPLFWLPFAAGVTIAVHCVLHARDYLAQWVLLFFGAALVLFYAGSARYLLPMALPVCLLLAQGQTRRWLWPAIAIQGTLSFALAWTNYVHWDGYRQLIARMAPQWENHRVWVNGEWGLRFYAESAGALPLVQGQAVRPGDLVLSSQLALPVSFTTGGGALAPIEHVTLTSPLPFRIIGLGSRSGYSTADHGFRHFDLSTQPLDILRLDSVTAKPPSLSHLPMNAQEAEWQIVSGVDRLEDNRYRWMGNRAVILLKKPEAAGVLQIDFYLPAQAPARRLTATVDGVPAGAFSIPGPGAHRFQAPVPALRRDPVTVVLEVDRTFQSAGDQRALGVILTGAGFAQP